MQFLCGHILVMRWGSRRFSMMHNSLLPPIPSILGTIPINFRITPKLKFPNFSNFSNFPIYVLLMSFLASITNMHQTHFLRGRFGNIMNITNHDVTKIMVTPRKTFFSFAYNNLDWNDFKNRHKVSEERWTNQKLFGKSRIYPIYICLRIMGNMSSVQCIKLHMRVAD